MNDIRYLTDHYDEKIKQINELAAPLNFVFITDMHHGGNRFLHRIGDMDEYEDGVNHIESIRYILDRCPGISCVINGGDVGNEYDNIPEKARETNFQIMDALNNLPVPVHSVIGNHDDMTGCRTCGGGDNTETGFSPDEMHELFMKYNPTPENYYYVDFEEQNYRFVFLNTSDKPYHKLPNGQYPYGWRLEISDAQAVWFEKEALATDKNIIIFSHSPIHNEGLVGTGGEGPGEIRTHDDLLNGPRIYDKIKRTPNVVACVAGHVHFDNLRYDDGVTVVTTLCSLVQEWTTLSPKRKVGTVTETAFDVFSIKGDCMYMTRFGAGRDREAYLPRVVEKG
ncbi:MAG: hypothetical protein E7638_08495 [Ruminococcaceae bacterium]|nr:hypothetical protein [Oscillospiraceae bacterium]